MKSVSFLFYEVDKNEIRQLPSGTEVLEVNRLYDFSVIKHAGIDAFRFQDEYKHYLMKAPALFKGEIAK